MARRCVESGKTGHVEVHSNGSLPNVELTQDLDLTGSGNTVTAVESFEIDIEGSDSQGTIDAVREIDLSGDNNTVIVQGNAPRVDDKGRGNTVTTG